MVKIKNLSPIMGRDEYYKGVSLSDCLDRMAVDIWISLDDEDPKTITHIRQELDESENIDWEVVK